MKDPAPGRAPAGPGWFVLNVADAQWQESASFGRYTVFEGEEPGARFEEVGVNVNVLAPGQPLCMYHRESAQEGFLVLQGECLLLVQGEERLMVQWDFFHCPAGTDHVLIGAGAGPCTLLALGARRPGIEIAYPASDLARRHGAGVEQETGDPKVAYADLPPAKPCAAPWPPRPRGTAGPLDRHVP